MKRNQWYSASWAGMRAGKRAERVRLAILVGAAAVYVVAIWYGL